MSMVLVGVGLTLVALFVLRPMYREYILGHHLTRLTSIIEQREQNRLIGVTPEAMPQRQRFLLNEEWEKGIEVFRRYAPLRITRELLKNSIIANASGRSFREQAIYQLIEELSRDGIALDLISFHQATSMASARSQA
ncbi:MAG: hypothetical protein EON86_00350 [Brevundimonas sp.]|nr:MAG: hypothetical protein EON86_00350 [Brevundimonas sp.]